MAQPTVIGVPGIGHEHLNAVEQRAMGAAWHEAINRGLAEHGGPTISPTRLQMLHWGPAMQAIEHPTPSPFARLQSLVTSPTTHAALAPVLAPIRMLPTTLLLAGVLGLRQWRRAVQSDTARAEVSRLIDVSETLDLPPDTAEPQGWRATHWASNVPAVTSISQWLRLRQVVHYREQHARRRQMLAEQIEKLWNDEPVIIVAHSLGTLVALQLLLMTPRLAEQTALFLTLGSPLWLSPLHETVLADLEDEIRVLRSSHRTKPPRAITLRHWVNIRDPRDMVAQRELASCLDARIVEAAVDGPGHDQYSLLSAPHTAAALTHALTAPAPALVDDDRRRPPPRFARAA